MNINNISPELWGPSGWKFLHYVTFTYPNIPTPEEKIIYKNFFDFAGKVLPCMRCRGNYVNHQKKYPLDDSALESKINLVNWLINIHNEVNIMNNKRVYTFDDVIEEYFIKANKNEDTGSNIYNKTILYFLLIIVILVIIWLSIKTYRNK